MRSSKVGGDSWWQGGQDAKDAIGTASLLMDIAKLRLRQLASEMEEVVSGTKRPRKHDIQKLGVSLKQVHGALHSALSILFVRAISR